MQWLLHSQEPLLTLHGTVALSASDHGANNWTRAFRYRWGEAAEPPFWAPFLTIELERATPQSIAITLKSSSFVWLRKANDLDGLINEDEADENLRHLGTFFWSLAERGADIHLRLDGRVFTEEETHLRSQLGILR